MYFYKYFYIHSSIIFGLEISGIHFLEIRTLTYFVKEFSSKMKHSFYTLFVIVSIHG